MVPSVTERLIMNDTKIKVLIVDDSAFIRKVFTQILSMRAEIDIVGSARNGTEALEKTAELHPDVVLLDVFMPELDGVGYLYQQMKLDPIPVILVTSAGEEEDRVIKAMEAGAIEFIQKPTARANDQIYDMASDLVQKILVVSKIPKQRLPVPNGVIAKSHPADIFNFKVARQVEVVVIGVSTGGPQALRTMLPKFPANFPVPIAVVLHMPVGFTESFASRLNSITELEVLEASEGLEMKPGRAIIGRAGFQMYLKSGLDDLVRCHLDTSPYGKGLYYPSTDLLFETAAQVYGSKTLGVILTGMGDDGTQGAAQIKSAGGLIYTESEESSIVYGMPRSVNEAGLADKIIPLNKMAERIMESI
jgi:two-component system, chemotaxis family, protein-glutamate methylesterase/glutaminase